MKTYSVELRFEANGITSLIRRKRSATSEWMALEEVLTELTRLYPNAKKIEVLAVLEQSGPQTKSLGIP